MTKLLHYQLILFLLFFASCFTHAQKMREVININRGWNFKLGDFSGAQQFGFNDSEWEKIGLPHSFSTPYFLSPNIYIGYGWYRKVLDIPKEYVGKSLSLEFEAAFQDAEVFVNGKMVGGHKGGYTGFTIDITKAIKEGENQVAVRLNNLWNPRLAPRAGGYVFSGGIYRDVYLVVTNQVHVTWYGTFVTTPEVSKESASIQVNTEIRNSGSAAKKIKLETRIYDPLGKEVASVVSTEKIAPGEISVYNQILPRVANPMLWHPDHPHLYHAKSFVYDGNSLTDQYETTFGIRWMEWTADKGFFLNGEHYYMVGGNVHQDHAGWSDAVTNAGMFRDVKRVKETGMNFIRGSHYPHDPAFSEACDQLGILLWQENALWGIGGFQGEGSCNSSAYPPNAEDIPEFEASVKQQLTEMIRIHRNHPSIIIWSMCNEPFFSVPETFDGLRNLLKESVELSHQLDPSRLAAIGGSQRPLTEKRIDLLGDVAGYNGDGSSIQLFQEPGIPCMTTEFGSVTSDRPGEYKSGWDHNINDIPPAWRSGQAIWSIFDYGCFAGKILSKMGLVDYFRIPKRSWYWYRNNYMKIAPPEWAELGIPAAISLKASNMKDIQTDGTDDTWLHVRILNASGKPISNSPSVRLEVVSGPGEFPTGKSILFEEHSDIRIQDGEAAIDFRSFYAGETVIKATSPGLMPAVITINFVGEVPYVKGITSEVEDRPYVQYGRSGQLKTPQKLGRNNPAFASSMKPDHITGLAGDGNPATWWEPTEEDKAPYWMLDMEKDLEILTVKIGFPKSALYKYKVDISSDKQNWQTILDNTSNALPETIQNITMQEKGTGRFIRISFLPGCRPMLGEVEVTGFVLD